MSAEHHGMLVVDTNVLLAATDRDRSAHVAAMNVLATDRRKLAICPQIIREYLAVATRPTDVNGLGLPVEAAIGNVGRFIDLMATLPENAETVTLLFDLLDSAKTSGRQVHDANVVAVALAHGAEAIVTDNTRHFERFADLIAIESL